MNGAQSKVARRDLRRAVGEEAVEIIDEHSRVLTVHVIPTLQRHQQAFADMDTSVDSRLALLMRDMDGLGETLATFQAMRFWARLRWLVTGR